MASAEPDAKNRRNTLQAVVLRAALFAMLWGLLSGTPLESWPYGLVTIGAALGLSFLILPVQQHWPITPRLPLLLPVAMRESLVGGLDVARRALLPSRPINPEMLEYRFRHGPGLVSIMLGYLVTIFPGTMTVGQQSDRLLVHVIDRDAPNAAKIARLEDVLHRVFRNGA